MHFTPPAPLLHTTPRPLTHRQRGATLIEVLVSLLISSLGVLGMVAMQTKSVAYAVDAEDRSRAAALVNQLVADMWLEGTNAPSTLSAWKSRVSDASVSGLPNGVGATASTTASGITTTTITVTWRAPSQTSNNTYYSKVVIP
nr:prepilin-type N-terminal cleavage/methylation domain-containing protein [uncultured Rhodoferax sp.]